MLHGLKYHKHNWLFSSFRGQKSELGPTGLKWKCWSGYPHTAGSWENKSPYVFQFGSWPPFIQSQQRQVKGVSQCTLLILTLLAYKWWFCLVDLDNSGWTASFKLTCLATSIPCNLAPYHQVTAWSQESVLGESLGKHPSAPCSNSSRSLSCRKNQRSRKSLKAAMSNRTLNWYWLHLGV